MIEAAAAAAESAADTFLGLPLPALLALISLVSVVLGAFVTGWVKKFRTPADNREDRVVVLDASDRLIERFENLLKASDEKHAKELQELTAKVEGLEKEVDVMRRERYTLVSAIVRIAQIARKYGGADAEQEIRQIEVPEGVMVA
jgi:hypothetical protein